MDLRDYVEYEQVINWSSLGLSKSLNIVMTTRLTGPRVVLSTHSPTDCNEKYLRHRSLWHGNLDRPPALGGNHRINNWTPWAALISCSSAMK
jgi:hypothetical protein